MNVFFVQCKNCQTVVCDSASLIDVQKYQSDEENIEKQFLVVAGKT